MSLAVLRAPSGITHAVLPDGTKQTVGPAGILCINSIYASALINGGFQIPIPDWGDDFVGTDYTIPSVPTVGMRYTRKNQGAGDLVAVADVAGGVISALLTSASAKQEGALYMSDQRTVSLEKGAVFEARVRTSVLPTSGSKMFIGLCGDYADGPDSITQSLWFALSGDGSVLCEIDDGTTDQSVDSTIDFGTAEWHDLVIDATNKANVKFYIDGVQVASGTRFNYAANGANATLQPYIGVYKASGTSVGTLQIDWARVYSGR